MPPTTHEFLELPGGRYASDQDEDGLWNVRDVPFFAELPAGVRGNPKPIDRRWLQSAVNRAPDRSVQDEYLAPIHANHHGKLKESFRIGFFRAIRVGQIHFEGKDRWALFGDILKIEPHHYDEVRRVRFPYRSVEISRDWKPEISSVALSEDEPPHFKFPMMTIGDEKPHPEPIVERLSEAGPAICFSDCGDRRWITFSFQESSMPDDKNLEKVATGDKEKLTDDKEKETLQEDKTASDIAKVIQDFQAKLPELVKSVLEGMIPPVARKNEAEEVVEPATAMSEAHLRMFSDLQTEVQGLKEVERRRVESTSMEQLVEDTSRQLSEDGWHVSEEHKGEMRKMANAAKDARTGVDIYATSFRANIPKEPARTLDELATAQFTQDKTLTEFTNRSPEEFSAAKRLAATYDGLVEGGAALDIPKNEFIEINLECEKRDLANV